MDDYTDFNRSRWDALAAADVEWSCPPLNLNIETARRFLDPHRIMGDAKSKPVLFWPGCLTLTQSRSVQPSLLVQLGGP